jgi:hypothetical protein
MTKTGLEFGILIIVICLIFEICDLEFHKFALLHHSSRLPQDRNIFGQLNKPGLSEVLRDSMKNYVF